MNEGLKHLVGRKIETVEVSHGEDYLRFKHDAGETLFLTDADCCSETWFADINGRDALRDATVLSAERIDLPDYNVEDGRTRQEEDEAYGFAIKTDRGVCRVVFRNSSNGYYGGEMTLAKELPDGTTMREINDDDWSA